MRIPSLVILLALAIAGCASSPESMRVVLEPQASVRDEPEDRRQALMDELGSEDPGTRDEATAALYELGPAILPLLDKASRTDPDSEVRGRAAWIADAIRLAERGFTVRDRWFKEDSGKLGAYMVREVEVRNWGVPVVFQNHGGQKGFIASYSPDGFARSLREIRSRTDLVEPLEKAIRGIESEEISSFLCVFLLAIDDPSGANAFVELSTSRRLRRSALSACREYPRFLARADEAHERKLIEVFMATDVYRWLSISSMEQPLHRYLVWMGTPASIGALLKRSREDQAAALNRFNVLECLAEFVTEPGFKALLEVLPTLKPEKRRQMKRVYDGRRDLVEIWQAPWFDGNRLDAAFR